MKLNKFLLSAIAAASLTACSDSTDVVDNNKGHWNADGTGYMSLSISMPDNVGSKGSRATNDDFGHGDANEYAVYNAMLVIFTRDNNATESTNEDNYKFNAAYELPLRFTDNTTKPSQISSKAIAHIKAFDATDAKALVILNKPQSVQIVNKTNLQIGQTEFSSTGTNNTFKNFKDLAIEVATDLKTGSGFTMTNAPLTTAHSTKSTTIKAGNTTTLAEVKKDNIKPTAEEADKAPATTVYVERSVAKVTLNNNKITGTLENTPSVHYRIESYALDNTNKTSYITRHVDNNWYNLKSGFFTDQKLTDDQYRFVGVNEVETDAGLYRTYWAQDPNYSIKSDAGTGLETTPTNFEEINKTFYCMENTFNVQSQTHRNTTRALLKVKFWVGDNETNNTLYMYNNDVSTLSDNEEGSKTFEKKVINDVNSIPAVKGYYGGVKSIKLSDKLDANGHKQIESVTYNVQNNNVDVTEDATNASAVFNIIKEHIGNISVYDKGNAYYSVLIKHFGDALTPWNSWESTKPNANNIYLNNDEANYLGRYGVVRNNWYQLNVTKVSKIGKPVIDTPDNTPDDELDSYISVSINILSWAKRSQDVDLQ
uniref:fimbria major subunit n=1 Tax=Alloprevotella sp. TaxID=1872471 RepID=UPI003FEE38B3